VKVSKFLGIQPRYAYGGVTPYQNHIPIQPIFNHQFLASVISRNQNAHSLVKGTTSFIKTYLTPSSITKNLNNINNILENYLQELEQTKQKTKKKKRSVHSACKSIKVYGF